ncbi:GNAT family N-acetyltransferase [Microlunatus sp. GCM10028923]|uniref:GNAT family N-acetyltransferase n=1 Tax=Microlunatus sp. GCM10028923 TaxID=3273400 RepID=UPI003613E2AF
MEIRTATAEDWPQIWPFFDRIVQARETYAYPLDLTAVQARDLWLQPPPDHAVVAVEDGEVLGSAKMGPNRPGAGSHIGTASFMVDPTRSGRGVGRSLATYMIDWHRRNGFHGIQFNAVVETNTAAVHLWQALGFMIIGTVPDAFDHREHGLVGLHVMYLPLT